MILKVLSVSMDIGIFIVAAMQNSIKWKFRV